MANYSIAIQVDGSLVVTDLRSGSPDGTDHLYGIESLKFFDTTKLVSDLFNHAPVLTGTQASLATGKEDNAYSVSAAALLNGFADPDGDTISVAGLGADHGTVIDNHDGTFTITPASNYNGTINLTYSVTDGKGGSALATQSFMLASVNDAPALTGAKATLAAGTEDIAYVVSAVALLAGFTDIDGDTLSVTGISADHGTVADNHDGTFTINPASNYNGSIGLSYDVTDGHGGSTPGAQSFALAAVNDAPTLTGAKATLAAGTEDTAYSVTAANLLAGFTDADGDTMSVSGLIANHGSVTASGNGTFTITPAANYNGPVTLSYSVTDGKGASTAANQSFSLAAVNDPPVITSNGGGATASLSIAENGSAVTTVQATDVESPAVTYAISGGADAALFQINSITGSLSFKAAPNFEVPTDAGANNIYDVIVSASDGSLSGTQAIAVSITNVVENQTRSLTTGADTFVAPSADNWTIDGLGGNDTITTLGGNDTVRGNAGDDTISTGGGNDTITFSGSGDGFDTIDGGAGTDTIIALAKNTIIGLHSVTGVETISANGFAGVGIAGTAGNEIFDFSAVTLTKIALIDGGAGDDTITGSLGNDTIQGNSGNDTIHSGIGGTDIVDGGAGIDTISFDLANAGVTISLALTSSQKTGNGSDTITNFENLTGSAFADTLTGNSGANILTGGAGNDTLTGGGGADTLLGGLGADTFNFAAIGDTLLAAKDIIMDFNHSEGDKIDLHLIDAIRGGKDNAFVWGDTTATAHGVWYSSDGTNTTVFGDTDGNPATIEFAIFLDHTATIAPTDFIL